MESRLETSAPKGEEQLDFNHPDDLKKGLK